MLRDYLTAQELKKATENYNRLQQIVEEREEALFENDLDLLASLEFEVDNIDMQNRQLIAIAEERMQQALSK